MQRETEITQTQFDCLLAWLHPTPQLGAEKYETIRRGLTLFFRNRNSLDSETLADETINRVTHKMPELAQTYEGEPVRYFYGVAHHVLQEYLRRPKPEPPPNRPEPALQKERAQRCREHCLSRLAPPERHLLLTYYQAEPHNKVPRRRALAAELRLTSNNLTVRAHRLRTALHECLERCLAESSAHDIFPL